MEQKRKIKVAIIGAGNCAKSLVEGVQYYSSSSNKTNDGMMRESIGGYTSEDIEFVCAFDIDHRKVGKGLGEALKQFPNCAMDIVDTIVSTAPVYYSPVIDGYPKHFDNEEDDSKVFRVSESHSKSTDINHIGEWTEELDREWKDKIIAQLKETGAEILVNYLPVGSQKATEFWAEICLETGIAFVNCMPVFIASNPEWEQKFIDANIPLIGDDMKSQIGASILSQMLQELAFDRGATVEQHYQGNVGGNCDFKNMMDRSRLASKKISKENVIRSQNDIRNVPVKKDSLYAGPSDYVPMFGDNKVATFRLELEGFGGAPVIFDARLSVQDSPNSAGVVIEAIRYLRVARELGIVGALRGPSAWTQKTPPYQMLGKDAIFECDELANRRLTDITRQQVRELEQG